MPKIIRKPGIKLNSLTLVSKSGRTNDGHIKWKVKCDCGMFIFISSNDFGRRFSCRDCGFKSISRKKTTHGLSRGKSRFYNIWHAMKERVLNKNATGFKNYGGRGIKICNEWLNFDKFHKDMYSEFMEHSKQYGLKNTTIDRIDNDGDYHKENCRWATYLVQSHNRRISYIKK